VVEADCRESVKTMTEGRHVKYKIETYTNKESKEIEDFINQARERLIKEEGLPADCILPCKIEFIREKK